MTISRLLRLALLVNCCGFAFATNRHVLEDRALSLALTASPFAPIRNNYYSSTVLLFNDTVISTEATYAVTPRKNRMVDHSKHAQLNSVNRHQRVAVETAVPKPPVTPPAQPCQAYTTCKPCHCSTGSKSTNILSTQQTATKGPDSREDKSGEKKSSEKKSGENPPLPRPKPDDSSGDNKPGPKPEPHPNPDGSSGENKPGPKPVPSPKPDDSSREDKPRPRPGPPPKPDGSSGKIESSPKPGPSPKPDGSSGENRPGPKPGPSPNPGDLSGENTPGPKPGPPPKPDDSSGENKQQSTPAPRPMPDDASGENKPGPKPCPPPKPDHSSGEDTPGPKPVPGSKPEGSSGENRPGPNPTPRPKPDDSSGENKPGPKPGPPPKPQDSSGENKQQSTPAPRPMPDDASGENRPRPTESSRPKTSSRKPKQSGEGGGSASTSQFSGRKTVITTLPTQNADCDVGAGGVGNDVSGVKQKPTSQSQRRPCIKSTTNAVTGRQTRKQTPVSTGSPASSKRSATPTSPGRDKKRTTGDLDIATRNDKSNNMTTTTDSRKAGTTSSGRLPVAASSNAAHSSPLNRPTKLLRPTTISGDKGSRNISKPAQKFSGKLSSTSRSGLRTTSVQPLPDNGGKRESRAPSQASISLPGDKGKTRRGPGRTATRFVTPPYSDNGPTKSRPMTLTPYSSQGQGQRPSISGMTVLPLRPTDAGDRNRGSSPTRPGPGRSRSPGTRRPNPDSGNNKKPTPSPMQPGRTPTQRMPSAPSARPRPPGANDNSRRVPFPPSAPSARPQPPGHNDGGGRKVTMPPSAPRPPSRLPQPPGPNNDGNRKDNSNPSRPAAPSIVPQPPGPNGGNKNANLSPSRRPAVPSIVPQPPGPNGGNKNAEMSPSKPLPPSRNKPAKKGKRGASQQQLLLRSPESENFGSTTNQFGRNIGSSNKGSGTEERQHESGTQQRASELLPKEVRRERSSRDSVIARRSLQRPTVRKASAKRKRPGAAAKKTKSHMHVAQLSPAYAAQLHRPAVPAHKLAPAAAAPPPQFRHSMVPASIKAAAPPRPQLQATAPAAQAPSVSEAKKSATCPPQPVCKPCICDEESTLSSSAITISTSQSKTTSHETFTGRPKTTPTSSSEKETSTRKPGGSGSRESSNVSSREKTTVRRKSTPGSGKEKTASTAKPGRSGSRKTTTRKTVTKPHGKGSGEGKSPPNSREKDDDEAGSPKPTKPASGRGRSKGAKVIIAVGDLISGIFDGIGGIIDADASS